MTQEELDKRASDDAYDQRLLEIFNFVTKSGQAKPDDTRKLFTIHNERFDPKESGYTCGSCVHRVINRVRDHLMAKNLI